MAGVNFSAGPSVGGATCECKEKIIDLKGFMIGIVFLFVRPDVGSWWFGVLFLQALLIRFVCIIVFGLIASFENDE